MHKKYKFSFIISLILCVTLIFNANTFKRDTYAVVAAVPVAVAVGDVVITISAAAVAALIACFVASGIDVPNIDAGTALIEDWVKYNFTPSGTVPSSWEFMVTQSRNTFGSLGLSCLAEDGNIAVDVPEHKAGTFTLNPDGTYSNLEWFHGGNLPQGSEPSNNGGKRIIAGFLASAAGLGSLGNCFSDYLHNSDTVTVVKPELPVVDVPFTGDNVGDYFTDFVADCMYNNDPYHLSYSISKSDFLSSSRATSFRSVFDRLSEYKYVDLYYHTSSAVDPKDKLAASTYCNYLFVGHNGAPGYDYLPLVFYICYNDYPPERLINYPSHNLLSGSASVPFVSGFYGNGYTGEVINSNRYETKQLTLSDYVKTAVFTNTDLVPDYEPELDPGVSPDKVVIGDKEYAFDPEGNVYDNPDYLTDSVAPAADPDTQEVIVTVPAFDPEGNIIPEPSVEPDSEPALDPFVNPDIGLNPSPSDDVMTSGNIFTLLASFFNTFWQNLKQTFTNVLNYFLTNLLNGIKHIFVPDVSVIENCVDNIKNTFLTTFGIGDFDISLAFGGEASLVDIPIDYETPDFHFLGIAVSYKHLIEALIVFRPYIRGLLCLLMWIYSINQFLGFINQMGITLGSWGTTHEYKKESSDIEHFLNDTYYVRHYGNRSS